MPVKKQSQFSIQAKELLKVLETQTNKDFVKQVQDTTRNTYTASIFHTVDQIWQVIRTIRGEDGMQTLQQQCKRLQGK